MAPQETCRTALPRSVYATSGSLACTKANFGYAAFGAHKGGDSTIFNPSGEADDGS